jgi:hypothetical protein
MTTTAPRSPTITPTAAIVSLYIIWLGTLSTARITQCVMMAIVSTATEMTCPAMPTYTTISTTITTRPSLWPLMTSLILNLVEAICPILDIAPLHLTTNRPLTILHASSKCANVAQCPLPFNVYCSPSTPTALELAFPTLLTPHWPHVCNNNTNTANSNLNSNSDLNNNARGQVPLGHLSLFCILTYPSFAISSGWVLVSSPHLSLSFCVLTCPSISRPCHLRS